MGTLEARNQLGAMLDGFPLRPEQAESGHFIGTAAHRSTPPLRPTETLLLIPGTNSYSYSLHVYQTPGGPDRLNQPVANAADLEAPARTGLYCNRFSWMVSCIAWLRVVNFEAGDWRRATAMQHPIRLGVRHTIWPELSLPLIRISPPAGCLWLRRPTTGPIPQTDHTHLRFMTTAAAEVSLSVITYAGQPVYETRQQTPGMMPTDVRINTRNWANGVYFARITARGDGKN